MFMGMHCVMSRGRGITSRRPLLTTPLCVCCFAYCFLCAKPQGLTCTLFILSVFQKALPVPSASAMRALVPFASAMRVLAAGIYMRCAPMDPVKRLCNGWNTARDMWPTMMYSDPSLCTPRTVCWTLLHCVLDFTSVHTSRSMLGFAALGIFVDMDRRSRSQSSLGSSSTSPQRA